MTALGSHLPAAKAGLQAQCGRRPAAPGQPETDRWGGGCAFAAGQTQAQPAVLVQHAGLLYKPAIQRVLIPWAAGQSANELEYAGDEGHDPEC
eukprot:CAMPEP_0181235914 /NCGR_PEP_ID=MMETSP1096-20121128/37859_1 /TAXON_ID=156174 ORGANISM="Chrysochromulina ericina, Strain CCMP281" /NCGR_SAMPLE_ID=MMETSP1096 /ASSEMBLY_ACC=CAM_ASM_000453 /LENGTH=92 /DNA_ID=CAMNT_0023330985 /DNA_START=377 /DNA_END=656 /DNA_ORIENTATION=+